jgi:hypothetical protein
MIKSAHKVLILMEKGYIYIYIFRIELYSHTTKLKQVIVVGVLSVLTELSPLMFSSVLTELSPLMFSSVFTELSPLMFSSVLVELSPFDVQFYVDRVTSLDVQF